MRRAARLLAAERTRGLAQRARERRVRATALQETHESLAGFGRTAVVGACARHRFSCGRGGAERSDPHAPASRTTVLGSRARRSHMKRSRLAPLFLAFALGCAAPET